jgi:hypothetical protein
MLRTQIFSRFRVRSPQRDKGADQARLLSVHQAINSAISSAEGELSGLQARLDSARQSAASLVGNDSDSDRDSHHEAELRAVEGRLLAAEGRIRQLTDHLASLKRIEVFVDSELTTQM